MKSIRLLTMLLSAILAFTAVPARAVDIGVTVFGGSSIPVVQEDVKSGTTFGARVPVALLPMITLEPYYASTALGDVTKTFGDLPYTRSGLDGKSYGVNLILGSPVGSAGFKFFPFGGIGSAKLTRPGTEIKETMFDFGLGIGIAPTHAFSIIARGTLNMVKSGDTTRKTADATVGLSYNIFHSSASEGGQK